MNTFGTLRPESAEQRSRAAKVTEADVDELRSRMAAITTPGEVQFTKGVFVTTSAAKVRALLAAEQEND